MRLLWVEDDEQHIAGHTAYLKEHGNDITGVPTPAKALAFLKRRSVELVITDIMMRSSAPFTEQETFNGHRTGLVLARRIRELYPEQKVVAFTIAMDSDVTRWFEEFASG